MSAGAGAAFVLSVALALGGLLLDPQTYARGTVTSKSHHPASEFFYVHSCGAFDADGTCTKPGGERAAAPDAAHPLPAVEPECWQLDLDDDGQRSHVCVSSAVWDCYRIGDRYPDLGGV